VERLLALGGHLRTTAVTDDLRRHVRAELQQPVNQTKLIGDHRQTERSLHKRLLGDRDARL